MTSNRLLRLVCAGVATLALQAPAVHAGEIDAGTYRLTYDDTLGAPIVSSASGMTTYTFVSFTSFISSYYDEVAFSTPHLSFAAALVAADGHRFAVRPDATFPVWAEMAVSDFAFDNVDPGATHPAEANARGHAVVTAPPATIDVHSDDGFGQAGPDPLPSHGIAAVNNGHTGASAARADVLLETTVGGTPPGEDIWYCPGCQYLGPDDPWPPLEWMGTRYGDIRVEARFTPRIVVDERFVAGVPEPSTALMLLAGGALTMAWRRRGPGR